MENVGQAWMRRRLTANMDRLRIVGKEWEEHEPISCTNSSITRCVLWEASATISNKEYWNDTYFLITSKIKKPCFMEDHSPYGFTSTINQAGNEKNTRKLYILFEWLYKRCFVFAAQTQSKVEAWARWSYNASTQFTVLCQQSIDLYISISIIINSVFRLCFWST